MNQEIYNKLKKLKPILKERFGIEEFALFGSVARGTDTEDSDVDIAILKFDLKDPFFIIEAKEFLKDKLQKDVDMGTFRSMSTFIKNRIKKDFVYV